MISALLIVLVRLEQTDRQIFKVNSTQSNVNKDDVKPSDIKQ